MDAGAKPHALQQMPTHRLPKASSQAEQTQQVWNLKDANIRAVIQTISALTGKNFIVDPRVSGKITLVSQRPMSTQEMYRVFLSLLQVLNYAAVPSGNVIKIVPAMNGKRIFHAACQCQSSGYG